MSRRSRKGRRGRCPRCGSVVFVIVCGKVRCGVCGYVVQEVVEDDFP